MPYCKKCGVEVSDSDIFCSNCGQQLKTSEIREENIVIVYKCPNCGEVIPSFSVNCPTCGLELRDRRFTAGHLVQFVETLNSMGRGVRGAKKKAKFIRSYTVPDNKEDVLEFLSYTSSGINSHLLSNYTSTDAGMKSSEFKAQKIISAAWIDKFDEMYHKAQLLFPNDPVMDQVQMIADQKRKVIEEARRSIRLGRAKSCLGVILVMFLGIALFIAVLYWLFTFFYTLIVVLAK